MKKIRKFLCIITSLLLVLSFTACEMNVGADDSSSSARRRTEGSHSRESREENDDEDIDDDDDEDNEETRNHNNASDEDIEYDLPEATAFVMENNVNSETVYLSLYPMDNENFIFQFDVISENHGTSEAMTYAIYLEKQHNNEFLFQDIDQNGDVVSLAASYIEGEKLSIYDNTFLAALTGTYKETTEKCEISNITVLTFLQNVPEAGIGDFGHISPMDEIECYNAGDWFIYCNLYSEGEFMYSFLVAKDFSVIINMTYPQGEVVYGSLDNTLNTTHTYEIINENDELVTIEEPLVTPVVYNGTTMTVGSTEEVFIGAPYDLTRSLEIVSENTDVVTVDGTEITAVAPGTATLLITADYCGTVKEFSLDIEVIE